MLLYNFTSNIYPSLTLRIESLTSKASALVLVATEAVWQVSNSDRYGTLINTGGESFTIQPHTTHLAANHTPSLIYTCYFFHNSLLHFHLWLLQKMNHPSRDIRQHMYECDQHVICSSKRQRPYTVSPLQLMPWLIQSVFRSPFFSNTRQNYILQLMQQYANTRVGEHVERLEANSHLHITCSWNVSS